MSTRRRFLKAAAALPLVAAPEALAGDPPASADAAMSALIRQRFKFLSDAQLKAVQTGLQRNVAVGEILKRFRLDPVDEPATIFVADLAE